MHFQIFFRKLTKLLFGPRYHPERHYMRGPGPKSQASALHDA